MALPRSPDCGGKGKESSGSGGPQFTMADAGRRTYRPTVTHMVEGGNSFDPLPWRY